MVKEFDEELAGRIAILVDCSGGGDKTVLDWAARAAGSVALACLDRGDHVDLVDLGRGETVSVSPFSDPDIVLTALARLEEREPGTFALNLKRMCATLAPRTALCFVFTAAVGDAHELAVGRLVEQGRRVSVCLPESVAGPDWPRGVNAFAYGAGALVECG